MEWLLLEQLFSLTCENGNFIGFNLEKSIFFLSCGQKRTLNNFMGKEDNSVMHSSDFVSRTSTSVWVNVHPYSKANCCVPQFQKQKIESEVIGFHWRSSKN